ncbi:hypothetical protein R3P38DRAFT_3203510 [Favolaschia claudopus]|uniref:Uncharacterized protein n=1 Tax=Favolaschia claudopus TaxID=2862362 RepID=A0AAW0AUJ0_9AGAR
MASSSISTVPQRRPRDNDQTQAHNDAGDPLMDALDAALLRSTFSFHDPAIPDEVLEEYETPTPECIEFVIRSGRHSQFDLYYHFMLYRRNAVGVYDIIFRKLYIHRTFKFLIEHRLEPARTNRSPRDGRLMTVDQSPMAKRLEDNHRAIVRLTVLAGDSESDVLSPTANFYAFMGLLKRSLTPANLAKWFANTFGPLIEAMEDVLREQHSNLAQDEDENDKPPAKRQRTMVELKCAKVVMFLGHLRALQSTASIRPSESTTSTSPSPAASNLSRTSTNPVRVKVAAVTSTRRSSLPSIPHFAPALDTPPKRMPGAWPLSPARRLSITQERSLLRRVVSNPVPQHFCPMLPS